MTRRVMPGEEPVAPDPASPSATGQSLEQIAERIAQKAVTRAIEVISNKFTDAFAAKVTSELLDNIAEKVANRIAARAFHDVAGQAAAQTGDRGSLTPKNEPAEDWPVGRSTLEECVSAAGSKRQSPNVEEEPPPKKPKTAGESGPRRNPKRQVCEEGRQVTVDRVDLADDLLVKSLKPLSAEEIQNWEGWCEVESEPAFFNYILEKLGVKGVVVKEPLSLESWALNFLPQPVFGLIFLFHYAPQLVDEEEEDGEEAPVWFANQTTNNSCASVALVNIVMNAEDVELGDELQNFKDLTKDLNSALRGYQIGANDFIRAAHNSFARRIDLLNADLCLANEVEAAQIEPPQKRLIKRRGATSRSGDKQKTAGPRTAAARAKKKQPHVEYGFHFIAYVPAGGFVWELDGMRTKPRNIAGGELTEKSWTDIVLPRIQHRIKEYGDSENGFSLLALCRSPLDTHRSLIASRLSGLRSLNTKMMGDSSFTDLVAASPDACASVVEGLDEFGLSPPIVYATGIPPFVTEHMARADFDHHEAYSLRQQLATDVATSMTKYREEVLAVAEEERRVQERRKDYMPALHCWMSKLASKGVLEEVMDTLRSGPADSP